MRQKPDTFIQGNRQEGAQVQARQRIQLDPSLLKNLSHYVNMELL